MLKVENSIGRGLRDWNETKDETTEVFELRLHKNRHR